MIIIIIIVIITNIIINHHHHHHHHHHTTQQAAAEPEKWTHYCVLWTKGTYLVLYTILSEAGLCPFDNSTDSRNHSDVVRTDLATVLICIYSYACNNTLSQQRQWIRPSKKNIKK